MMRVMVMTATPPPQPCVDTMMTVFPCQHGKDNDNNDATHMANVMATQQQQLHTSMAKSSPTMTDDDR